MRNRCVVLAPLCALLVLFAGCGGGGSQSQQQLQPGELATIVVRPLASPVEIGDSVHLNATAADGSWSPVSVSTFTGSANITLAATQIPGQGVARLKFFADSQPRVFARYASLPLSFELNEGQANPTVRFVSRGPGYTLFLTPREMVLGLAKAAARQQDQGRQVRSGPPEPQRMNSLQPIRLQLLGANPHPAISGESKLPTKSNYFIGNNPAKWRVNVPNYGRVRFREVYPGIDLVYYGNQRQLEHDFVVSPRADPARINFKVLGVQTMRVDNTGNLNMVTTHGELKLLKPTIYQIIAGTRRDVEGRYVLGSQGKVGFEIARFDRSESLVVDPILVYSTYLGGNRTDRAYGVAVDSSGSAYIAGVTDSVDFPTMNPFQSKNSGNTDIFVTKLSPDGSTLVYSTFLGGSDYEDLHNIGAGLAVDSSGNVFVTGSTSSTDFPVVNAVQSSNAGGQEDAFVAKLNPTGSSLMYSTYLGGSGGDRGQGIAVDTSDNAYVIGDTDSTDFPTVNALQVKYAGSVDLFVAKISADGSTLLYSTYLGGSQIEWASAIAVDSSGNASVTGGTSSIDFPTMNPLQSKNAGGFRDAFVARLNPTGTALLYSTYLGGSSDDIAQSIALDSSGNVYLIGDTYSTDFPTVNPFQSSLHGLLNAFVAKVKADGSALVYSTYLGGSRSENGRGVGADALGNAYVVGNTYSRDFPTADAFQNACGGTCIVNGFVTSFDTSGSQVIYSSFLGGSGDDYAFGVALDSSGNAYVVGEVSSTDFPTVNPYQATNRGAYDAFISKISSVIPAATLSPSSLGFGNQSVNSSSAPQVVTLANLGGAPLTISGIVIGGADASDYVQTNSCGNNVAAGSNCSINVTFTPTAAGARAATLAVTDNAGGGSQTAALSGQGSDFSLSASPTAASVNPGQSAIYTLSVVPAGGFNQAVSLTCSGNPATTNCSISPPSVTPDGTNPITATITVTTTAPISGALPRSRGGMGFLATCVLFPFVSVVGISFRPGVRRMLVLLPTISCLLLWVSCGSGGGGQPGTPAGTYSINVTGMSGTLHHNASVTLTLN